jgi:hypothetical protein
MRDKNEASHPCLFCGASEHVAVFEVWGHEFMLETCCPDLHEQIAREMAEDPAWGRKFLHALDIESLCGHELRRVANDGCGSLVLDWQLRLAEVSAATARRFIAEHHAHCGPPTAWRFQGAVFNGVTLLGIAIVGNPVARALAGRGILEVNRLCVRRDVPEAFRWNAASMLYGWSAREAQRRGWSKIITYTRADEPGTSLDATGWKREATVRGRGWHGTTRRRSNRNAWIDKVRWGRDLHPPRRPTSNRLSPAEPTFPLHSSPICPSAPARR